jgi:crotonobetainyl-CoA:carnitine CoA-transferase CaiB-like acyl-CoA transferase
MPEPTNIFSGLRVVDFASFIAGAGAATILSDFGAEVVKVEPPTGDPWRNGHKRPPQPQAEDPYQWHLANPQQARHHARSESAERSADSRAAGEVGRCTHRQHAARKKLKLELTTSCSGTSG